MLTNNDIIAKIYDIFHQDGNDRNDRNDIIVTYLHKLFKVTISNEYIFGFFLEGEFMYVCYLQKTQFISGKKILEHAEKICEFLPKIKWIELHDQSAITVNQRYGIGVYLSKFRILAKGESWYNSLGYYQKNYDDEKIEWNKIRNTNFADILDDFRNKEYELTDMFDVVEGIEPFEELSSNSDYRILIDTTYNFIKNELKLKFNLDINSDNIKTSFIFDVLYHKNSRHESNGILCFLLVSIFSLYIDYDNLLLKNLN